MIPLQSCLPTIEGSAHGSGFLERGSLLLVYVDDIAFSSNE